MIRSMSQGLLHLILVKLPVGLITSFIIHPLYPGLPSSEADQIGAIIYLVVVLMFITLSAFLLMKSWRDSVSPSLANHLVVLWVVLGIFILGLILVPAFFYISFGILFFGAL